MRFDLVDLRLFLAVVEAGSITRGAQAVNLSLSAASERLGGMEADCGLALLERGRRGVLATEAGEAVAHQARLVLREVSQLSRLVGEHARIAALTLRLAANTAALSEFLPERLGSWLAVHPQVSIDLRERQSADVAKALLAGHADLGVMSAAADPGGLHLTPFAVDRLALVCARGHPLADRKTAPFDAVLDYPMVGLMGGALQDHLDAQAASLGRKVAYRIRTRTFGGVCRLAAQGVGIGIAPLTAARRHRDGLAVVRLSDAWATRRLSLACLDPLRLPAPARDLLAHLAAGGPTRREPA